MRICNDGEWQAVIVDDCIPCYGSKQGPAFTKGVNNEIWVLLLEKVWAKINGSYENIESGNCREALRSLTGAPTKMLYVLDQKNNSYLNNSFDEDLEKVLL